MEATKNITVAAAKVDAYIEAADPEKVARLKELAARVDDNAGAEEPEGGYTLASAFAAVMNGGTREQCGEAFALITGWSFSPEGGW